MKTYINNMKNENVSRAILVVQQNLTPFAKTCIQEFSQKFHLEVFQASLQPALIFLFQARNVVIFIGLLFGNFVAYNFTRSGGGATREY